MSLDTRRLLHLLRATLLGLTAIMLTGATIGYLRVHNAAETAGSRSVPVLREVSTARTALVRADWEVLRSFRTGAAALIGAGDGYRDQLAIAAQSLTRVAEANLAGDAGGRQLQLVDSLLATYSASVEQAATQHRLPGGGPVLGAADLWQASRLLHSADGVLRQLDQVALLQRDAFRGALTQAQPTTVSVAFWLLPGGVLLLGLLGVQWLFWRRFRRRFNPWLLAATGAVAGLLVLTTTVFDSQRELDSARGGLEHNVAQRLRLDAEIDAEGQRWLGELMRQQCPEIRDCGPSVGAFLAGLHPIPDGPAEPGLTEEAGRLAGQVREVGGRGSWWPGIPVLAALVLALVLRGFQARLAEYRSRVRR
ncbi:MULTISPECIES: hypothetical protein [unclassified Crossiella]|uniref:hypothetical protein n=1 Tax=unclassified Crossiella TaxID=2620835 RepID=UPI001FFEE7C0|nr:MULTISPECIES: hypothetical protein [unclassified Crossiella]MCK2237300.1 hypothetical protein [Crossiella sp. S99.2]MCK2250955.1 hypothetical protein [Crossiella sp. S99.1]